MKNTLQNERRAKIDTTYLLPKEVKEMCDLEGYSTSTYRRSLKRRYVYVTVGRPVNETTV